MKRSEINDVLNNAKTFFESHSWTVLPDAKWDVTNFGLNDFKNYGLVLVNLAEEPEYCEKLMFSLQNQHTPAHYHKQKKEDIICRVGELSVKLWNTSDQIQGEGLFNVKVNGKVVNLSSGDTITLKAGERVTIHPGLWHEFWPLSTACIIGEVSTLNDDLHDNFFANKDIGRYPEIEEDEPPLFKLLSDS